MNLIQQANVSPQWRNKTLGSFDRSLEPEAYDIAEKYIEKWQACRERGIGLLFQSQVNGVGKTHLAWAITVAIIRQYPHEVKESYTTRKENISAQRWDVSHYLERLQASYYSHNSTVSEAPNVELLVLDDLGQEYSCKWSRARLRDLFNIRHERIAPSIITTTASILTLRSRLGADVMDRILGRSIVVEFQSQESYRKKEIKGILEEIGL